MAQVSKKYRQGSFRGAQFQLNESETETGRRNVKHEFPGRDTNYTEDTGRKTRVFTISVFVLGASYEADRDALIAACETSGVGTLIHPFYGTKQVVCDMCRYRETKDELGIVNFQLTFAEAGSNVFPTSANNPLGSVLTASTGALGATASSFSSTFSVISASASTVASAQSSVDGFVDQVQTQLKGVNADVQALANLSYGLRNLRASALVLLSQPALLAERIQNMLAGFSSLSLGTTRTQIRAALGGMLEYGTGFPPIAATTPNRTQAAQNQRAMIALVQQSALSNLAVEAATDTYGSFDDAQAQQLQVTNSLDAWMIDPNTSDDLYGWLQSLRVQTILAVPGASEDLPRITTFTPQITTPSIVLTYELYNDPALEADIIARNPIKNPAFIAQGRPLSVILDQTS